MSTDVRMAYIPGERFTVPVQERRTASYRTWHGQKDMGWCWECLLCGQWESSQASREAAAKRAGESHPGWCHVVKGCSCHEPHITAAQGARLGISGVYPAHLAPLLLKLAGGTRKPCPPCFDRQGTPHCDTAQAIVTARANAA